MSDMFLETLEKLSQAASAPPLELMLIVQGQRISGTIVTAEEFATDLTLQLRDAFPPQPAAANDKAGVAQGFRAMYHGKREEMGPEIQRTARDGDYLHLKNVRVNEGSGTFGFIRIDRGLVAAYAVVPPPPAPKTAKVKR